MKLTIRTLLLAWGACLAILALVVGCGSETNPPAATLTSIGVMPENAALVKGTTLQLTAQGTYSDGLTKNITTTVTWSSSNPAAVTISNDEATKGLATGVGKGSATITASITEGGKTITGGTALTVNDVALKSLAITPATSKLAKGTMVALTATGTFADDTTQDLTESVTWSSSAPLIVAISDAPGSKGLVNAVDVGSATVTASLGDVTATLDLAISDAVLVGIEVNTADPWIPKGKTAQFTALGIFTDGTTQDLTIQVAWASSDPIVTISNDKGTKGLATGVAEGETTISATLMGVTGMRPFTVTSATIESVTVTPAEPTIAAGTGVHFQATGILSDGSYKDLTTFATWASTSEAIATISNDHATRGLATAVSAGVTTISATYLGKSGSTALHVTAATLVKLDLLPQNPMIAKGVTRQFAAIGTFSDKSAQDLTNLATWGSTDTSVATVSNTPWSRGLATTLTPGLTTISASVNGKSDATVLTVTQATLSFITITPPDPTLAKGTTLDLTATGVYSDNTTQDLTYVASWSSSDPSVFVNDWLWMKGIVKGLAVGSSTIKATVGGKSAVTLVTVSAATLSAVSVTPANASIAKGTSLALEATGIYSDNSTQDLTSAVTWSSSDASVSVSNALWTHGLATGLVEGQSTITAAIGGKSGHTKLTVTAATLVSIAVTPEVGAIAKGTTLQLKATGTYTDNSKQDLTTQVSWTSSSPNVFVSNTMPNKGMVWGAAVGSAMITASSGDKEGVATVNVTAATLSTLTVLPADATIAKGTVQQFKVNGTYSDNTIQDLTEAAGWSSSDTTKVILSNAVGSHGLATGVSQGAVTVTAAYQGKSAFTSLTVTAATLVTIGVEPSNASMAVGGTLQFFATGTYTDNSTQNITSLVTWVSSNEQAAIISNAFGSRGLATGVAGGSTTIQAFFGGKSGSTALNVHP